MAPATRVDQGHAQQERLSHYRPSLRTVGAAGVSRFRVVSTLVASAARAAGDLPPMFRRGLALLVVGAFVTWFYVSVLAGAIRQRIDFSPRIARPGTARALTLAVLVIAVTSTAGTAVARERTDDRTTRPKVVVVVGPVGPRTAEYEARGRSLAAHARRLGARVTAIYPPRATWSRVAQAAKGANVFVYMGHGNGWPSPYPPFQTATKNGLGLDPYEGAPSGAHRYYGERYVGSLRLAKDAVVLLVGLCYSSGNAEPGMVIPSRNLAQERVDNYGAGFLRAGARAVFSDGFSDSSYLLDDLFRSDRSMRSIFWSSWRATGVNDSTFRSERVRGMTGIVDPQLDGDYYHSFIGDADFRASEWRGETKPDAERPPRDEVPRDPPRDGPVDAPPEGPPEDEGPADAPAEPAADRRRTTGHLHLRNGPSPSERVLGYVLRGTEVVVLERREHNGPPDWLRVRLPSGREGWVWGQWVSGR